MDRTKLCDSLNENVLYKLLKLTDIPPCDWCTDNLSNDQASQYRQLTEDHDTVIPNCGSQHCILAASSHTSRGDGFIVKCAGRKESARKRQAKKEEKDED